MNIFHIWKLQIILYNFSKEIKESNKFNKKEKIGIKKN